MTTDTVGGVWTFTIELARQLHMSGVEVVLAALGGTPSAQQFEEAAALPNVCLLPSNYKLEWMEDPWRDVEESGRWLLRLADEYKPDLVHLNSFGHAHLKWPAPTVLTAHSCVFSWWAAIKKQTAPAGWDRYRNTVEAALNSATVVTTPSTALAESLRTHYKFDALPLVIPNGRSEGLFYASAKQPLVLTAGRLWDEAKNLEALAQIADQLSWPVYAAGNADHPSRGATDCSTVRLLGSLSTAALADWMSKAAIFALPARYEPFGLSILEAAMSGCALVLGDIPSLREVWQDAALYVHPDDPATLAHTLQRLIDDADLRTEMVKRSQIRAQAFQASRTASLYLYAYRSAVRAVRPQCVS